ncbi:pancreatic triacylglycerol lipase-like [Zerene cesonia]|uniref:pancreatic triacylglycerol lipase-like n=1 Tax=Zerene cesonia TaxID=33412 RepID=UPI0018E5124E|nr:pancreatic triacylglycerol lipase-like [Zerene cesonia]
MNYLSTYLYICALYKQKYTAVCGGNSIPWIPGDNSQYVEGVSRYVWIPDGDSVPHLVDLEEPADESFLNARNGANNAYWLYTRRNPLNYQTLRHNDDNSVKNSSYNDTLPLAVIVHGWSSNGHSAINPLIRDAILHVGDFNIIVVDWHKAANSLYTTSVRAVPCIGNHLGNFVQWLFDNHGGNWDKVHFIGFSLGAHVVGNAGRAVSGRIKRITGLDPAGPEWSGNSGALKRSDAGYVECIHTDGGLLGTFHAIGDADFYPNGGGNRQPGCFISTCSHSRSYELFADTVRYNRLSGRECVNLNEARSKNCSGAKLRMGNIDFNKKSSGIFGLTTGSKSPF